MKQGFRSLTNWLEISVKKSSFSFLSSFQ
ncbi:hypothetical protein MED297_03667 [Reinekea sp. MED297]|uniref:Uncharacterized protein n=1 Tax=Reinekea blandensis MED297 TaxID=314283 RepID=A4BFT8_9GAMM|nr:hypothetical protein MED297_03667 [Reinekea sp. MED297] [Reinekea blandensis MED297]